MPISKGYDVDVDGLKVRINVVSKRDVTSAYEVSIPEISLATTALLDSVKEDLLKETKIVTEDIFDTLSVTRLKDEFRKKASMLIEKAMPKIPDKTKSVLVASLLHEMLGLGEIEILLADVNLEEIVINSSKEPLWVYHKEFGWLKSNIYPKSEKQIQNYASIIARRIGRQISVLEPLLDAHLITGDRANATLFPVSTKGNTLTIRKFARKPWTITDFVETKTLNSEVAAFLWLIMQYELNMIIAGGTSSGKTSFLNTLMPFIQPNHRIISIEDSVTGDTEIIIKKGNKLEIRKIEEIVNELANNAALEGKIDSKENLEVLSLDRELKLKSFRPSAFYRHRVNKDIYEITTSTGKKIKVTEDHSLFTLGTNGGLKETKPTAISRGDFIATPRIIPYDGNEVHHLNLLDHLEDFDGFILGKPVCKILSTITKHDKQKYGISKNKLNHWKKRNIISTKLFTRMTKDREIIFSTSELEDLKLKLKRGKEFPIIFELTDDFLALLGFWLGDGCFDYRNKNRVLVTSTEEECAKLIKRVAANLKIKTYLMKDNATFSLNSTMLYRLMRHVIGLEGYSNTKKIPNFIFNLSNRQLGKFLQGYFSADGTVKTNEISCSSQSLDILNAVQTILLRFRIIGRIRHSKRKDNCYELCISSNENIKEFFDKVGFLQTRKTRKIAGLVKRISDHTSSDVIPIRGETAEALRKIKPISTWYFNQWHIGRNHLQRIVEDIDDYEDITDIQNLAFSDVFWDKVTKVKKFDTTETYVYDISVPQFENFVANNFIVHNTRELQLPDYLHWVPLTTREPNPEGKGSVDMLDLMVNSLRMRPDRIVVGEIRRAEQAEVLFEAMHTGHSVYATLHADTVEQVIRRMTNPPINIPDVMLEALHVVGVMYRDRRKGIRRMYQLAELLPTGETGDKIFLKPNLLYRYKPSGEIVAHGECVRVFDTLRMHTNMTQKEIIADLSEKIKVINWLVQNHVNDINHVGKIIATYYANSEVVVNAAVQKLNPNVLLK